MKEPALVLSPGPQVADRTRDVTLVRNENTKGARTTSAAVVEASEAYFDLYDEVVPTSSPSPNIPMMVLEACTYASFIGLSSYHAIVPLCCWLRRVNSPGACLNGCSHGVTATSRLRAEQGHAYYRSWAKETSFPPPFTVAVVPGPVAVASKSKSRLIARRDKWAREKATYPTFLSISPLPKYTAAE